MLIECNNCGAYEIGLSVYDTLLELPKKHWQIDRLRAGLVKAKKPVKITKTSSNILEVEQLGKKLTKLQKWSVRERARENEGRPKVSGRIDYIGTIDE
ncbi:MAG: hypothetical protein CME43_01625 [Haliea sp.]|jgi:hypothetical protein|uniref:hypothetical protein n=1 Tax=Haliea sp. TaxID=1932666 RepID=UPI000C62D93B|nr:hypothetical protein [Haliea sp.]MBM68071.1 hypothetical protein [Haliea sp.]MBM68161.1 hypothetical protein [Haliea sp.]|tara:strand:+ start:11512 stop:11805 length:294 start_codon:yes stop_codon:yes gene_type:complete